MTLGKLRTLEITDLALAMSAHSRPLLPREMYSIKSAKASTPTCGCPEVRLKFGTRGHEIHLGTTCLNIKEYSSQEDGISVIVINLSKLLP